MWSSTMSTEDRVRNSELFPRIRDAESVMHKTVKKLKDNYDEYNEEKTSKMGVGSNGSLASSTSSTVMAKKKKKSRKINNEDQLHGHNSSFTNVGEANQHHVEKEDYFKSVTLSKDTDLYYPKLFGQSMDFPPDSIQTLWMSGFLDRAQRDGKMLMAQKLQKMMNVSQDELLASVASTSIVDGPSNIDPSSAIAIATKKKKMRTMMTNSSDLQFKLKVAAKMKPYMNEVKKIKMQQLKIKPPEVIDFVSTELEGYFEHLRLEHEAAAVIQSIWRRSHVLGPWKLAIKCMLAAAKIQRVARGMITRKWVARWFSTRNTTVTDVQAQIRKVLSNKHIRPQLKAEQKAAIVIQRHLRGILGRAKWKEAQGHIAATRLQCIWRGTVARAKADRKWLNKVVVPIQRHGRSMSAVKKVEQIKADYYAAASSIQGLWRKFSSSRDVSAALAHRDVSYVNAVIGMLGAEEDFYQTKLERLIERLLKSDLRAQAEAATDRLVDLFNRIRVKENDCIEMKRQRETLSPRALQQGWIQELDKNIHDYRNDVTELKLQCLFHAQIDVHNVDQMLEDRINEIEEVNVERDRVADCREKEKGIRQEKVSYREGVELARENKIAIADERRKWAVKYYTSDGRPDKKRRPGRPWDASVYAGIDKNMYTSVGIDLMALNPKSKDRSMKLGSDESVKSTLEQMSLHTYLEQMNAYEQILNPIQEIVQKTYGAPPNKPGPQKLGFGKIGATLAPALWNIDAVPDDWKRPLTPNGTRIMLQKDLRALDNKRLREERSQKRKERMLHAMTADDVSVDSSNNSDSNSHRRHTKYDVVKKPESSNSLIEYKSALDMQQEGIIREEVAESRKEHQARRKERARQRFGGRDGSKIPWSLLDQLEGAKRRLEVDKLSMDIGSRRDKQNGVM